MSDTMLGQIIGQARSQQGYTKARLAREVQVSDTYLVHIEAGRRVPSEAVLRRLARALGIPVADLIAAALHSASDDATQKQLRTLANNKTDRAIDLARKRNLDPSDEVIASLAEFYAGNPYAALPFDFTAEGEPIFTSSGPEGWHQLSRKDQRMVQQLINRLRASAEE